MKRMSGLMLKRRSTQSMDSSIAENTLNEEKETHPHKNGSSEESNSDEEIAHFVYSRVYTTTFTLNIT